MEQGRPVRIKKEKGELQVEVPTVGEIYYKTYLLEQDLKKQLRDIKRIRVAAQKQAFNRTLLPKKAKPSPIPSASSTVPTEIFIKKIKLVVVKVEDCDV